ncbi:MAG TPA: RluA family pseudouridine synthase [Chthoniobacteraceae bacterium]|nr:RluA family pseudouridine synthase [Chthoniobacteraceae bacterium]
MQEYRITPEEAGTRLDQFLAAAFPEVSRARLQQLVREGEVLLNGKKSKPGEKLRPGAVVSITPPEPPPEESATPRPEAIPLDIVFEDETLLVVNKPAGLVVHPAAGNETGTLVNALLHHTPALSTLGGALRPGIVHRLDKETSGLLLAAKDDATHQALAGQFAERTTLKVYLALASGTFRQREGIIDAPIVRHTLHRKKMTIAAPGEGREARTAYRVLKELGKPKGASQPTLVECTLHTGRTHQIRVHLKHLGHPLLGDTVYGRREHYPRQMLHAWKLGFTHPRSGERLQFEAPLPDDFRDAGVMLP